MSRQDVEHFQSFCRRWINRTVKEHFKDLPVGTDGSLDTDSPRGVIRDVCLHKDTDPMMLTIGRLLIWWVEARGLLDEYIYGIPSTDFDISNTYYPQVKLHFKESRYDSSTNNRKPIRSEISFRWRETDFTKINIEQLALKIHNDFAKPVFIFDRGKEFWTYTDKSLGYYFQVKVTNETEAKKIIEQVINIQDENEPDWENNLRKHEDKQNYAVQETVRIYGETHRKPKKRPVGTVKYQYAELFIHGLNKPIILSDVTSFKPDAIKYL